MKTRIIKPAKCESELLLPPIGPCEMLPNGYTGILRINGTEYAVSILGHLPPVGEPVFDGFRLAKDNGETHDLCLVAGRLECTCGDFEFRRAGSHDRETCDCKHILAVKREIRSAANLRDQYEPATVASDYAVELDDL